MFKVGDKVKIKAQTMYPSSIGKTGTVSKVTYARDSLEILILDVDVYYQTCDSVQTLLIEPCYVEPYDGPDGPRAGYHLAEIMKGNLGYISKIREELEELEDAELQGSKIMMAVECADLYGALRAFADKQLGLSMQDIERFSTITERVFKNGHR